MRLTRLGFAAATAAIPLVAAAQQPAAPPPIDETLVPYASTAESARLPDGRALHWVCMGEGSPTVILSAGAGDWSATWSLVQPAIARTTRVCAWDRAGFGFSTAAAEPQAIDQTTADLAAGLKAGGIAGPYVLVGHSAGAYESLLLADRQPGDIAGMVLVDPAFPDEKERLERASPAQAAYTASLSDPVAPLVRRCIDALRAGTLRQGGPDPDGCLRPPSIPGDPPALVAARERMIAEATPQAIAGAMEAFLSGNSMDMLAHNAKLAVNTARDYRDMPLIVLTRTTFGEPPPDYPAAGRAEIPAFEAEWNRGHDELAALSSRGINARVPGSGHDMQHMKPQAVIDAVEQVVREVREAR